MNEIKFSGSKQDMAELREIFTKAGFEEVKDDVVRASDASVAIPSFLIIAYAAKHALPEVGKCIRAWMDRHKDRTIEITTPDGTSMTLKGDFTNDELEKAAELAGLFSVAEPVNPNKESEMGFHVGLDKAKKE